MRFRQFIEATYYHQTSPEAAESILQNGIDVSKQQGGLFPGFYISPNPNYGDGFSYSKSKVKLAMEVDERQIMDVRAVTDEDLTAEDGHWKMMGPGWRNTLITRIAKSRGYNGLRNGTEVILFNSKPVSNLRLVQ